MSSFWKKITGGEPEPEKDKAAQAGQYGADYVGMSDLMKFNQNLLDALKHEQAGLEFYRRFLEEANDERGREMYRRLIEEEERHLKMVQEEIDEHKKSGYWS
jgi:rubrerythrin